MANSKNFLDYTKSDYASIQAQLVQRLNQDERFKNFRESAIAKTMIDIFAATTEFNNYYIERRAEETADFDTAQLRSSIVSLSNRLAYVIQRPIPANATLQIVLKNSEVAQNLVTGDSITFGRYSTQFDYNGTNFILKKTYKYTFTESDIASLNVDGFEKIIDGAFVESEELSLQEIDRIPDDRILPIEILQGEIKTNPTIISNGEKFQKYSIEDPTFSNMFGKEDFSYNIMDSSFDLTMGLTKVGVGNSVENALETQNLFEIDRRSLLTSKKVLALVDESSEVPKVCAIKTTKDDLVRLEFGDDIISVMPSDQQVIVVQYLSTSGDLANQVGVIGDVLTPNTNFVTEQDLDITEMVEFRFNSNITGGAGIETVESIKIKAPATFYAGDRLVTKDDYINFLGQLLSPIRVKNGIAWGEQEEVKADGVLSIPKLFNVVLFSVLGDLYKYPSNGTSGPKTGEELSEVYLEGSGSHETLKRDMYFQLFVKDGDEVADVIRATQGETFGNIYLVRKQLNEKGQTTTRHIYIPPIIQDYSLKGTVKIRPMASTQDVSKVLNNDIYKFLKDNSGFSSKVSLSDFYSIIRSNPSVESCYLELDALEDVGTQIASSSPEDIADNEELNTLSPAIKDAVVNAMSSRIISYENNPTEISQRSFYKVLYRQIYNALGNIDASFRDSTSFRLLMLKVERYFKKRIRENLLDAEDEFTKYSLQNEIIRLYNNINVTFRV